MHEVKYKSWTPQRIVIQWNVQTLVVHPKLQSPDLVAIAARPKSWETERLPVINERVNFIASPNLI